MSIPPTPAGQTPADPVPTGPESTTPTHDLTGLFAPAVLAWLGRRGCERAQWSGPAGAAPAVVAGQLEFAVDIGSAPGTGPGLRLVFATVAVLAQADEAAVRAYLAAIGPFLRDGLAAPPGPVVSLSLESLLAMEHQLRNHLNSLLMSAAALSLKCEAQDGVDAYLDQMERDGRDCLALLRGFSAGAAA